MLGKILPLLLAVLGLGAGIGGGLALRPPTEDIALAAPCGEPGAQAGTPEAGASADTGSAGETSAHDYVKLNNQFVVPVVEGGRVSSLVVLSLNVEVEVGRSEEVYQREPRLRDALLRVMFDHANAGGFNGSFTKTGAMQVLRSALREAAQKTLGPVVSDVLITDIVRQDA